MGNKILPNLCEDERCTGCLACVNTCNKDALTISVNAEGFYRPLLDIEKCMGCGACERNCPIAKSPAKQNKGELKVYAVWNLDENVRRQSSSGGLFTALAETVIEMGGAVFGAAYTKDFHVAHIVVSDKSGLEQLRLSKYAQSCVGKTLRLAKEMLNEGRTVLYVGTPCQISGLKSYLHNDYDNLFLVDFICHGTPSNDMLQSYLKWLEKKFGKINHLNFRDKRKGWYDALRVIKTDDGEKVLRGKYDNYWVGFNNNNDLQMSCYHCPAQGFPRQSDITMADFWQIGHRIPFGHKVEIEKGVSMAVVNSKRGANLLEESKGRLFIEERSLEETILGNMASVRSSECPESRKSIYQDLKTLDFDNFGEKYLGANIKQTAVKWFREYLPYWIIKQIRLLKQK